jgi:hypothetical protein
MPAPATSSAPDTAAAAASQRSSLRVDIDIDIDIAPSPSPPSSSQASPSSASASESSLHRRGRPLGSRDRIRGGRQRPNDVCGERRLDLTQCKLDLLKILLHTHDFGNGWEINDTVRYLFAHTRGFREWGRAQRLVDSLAHQMRKWLSRDIAPLVESTSLFTVPLPDDYPLRHRKGAQALLTEICLWVKQGAALDCLVPQTPSEPDTMSNIDIMDSRRPQGHHHEAQLQWPDLCGTDIPSSEWVRRGTEIWRARRSADRVAAQAAALRLHLRAPLQFEEEEGANHDDAAAAVSAAASTAAGDGDHTSHHQPDPFSTYYDPDVHPDSDPDYAVSLAPLINLFYP